MVDGCRSENAQYRGEGGGGGSIWFLSDSRELIFSKSLKPDYSSAGLIIMLDVGKYILSFKKIILEYHFQQNYTKFRIIFL